MKSPLFFIFFFFTITTFGQEVIEPCKFGQPLLDALQAQYTPNTLGYGPARDILYSEIDNNGVMLSGIYTGFTVSLEPGADPSVSAFDQGINAEHVYPRSLGAEDEPMRSDMHNIFPSRVNVNQTRGNCPYAEIEDNDTENWYYLDINSNSIPLVDIEKYSEKDQEDCFFEPREEVKGNIARAMFYFYGIYQDIADAEDPNFLSAQKEVLYLWHLQDPVDQIERNRDSLIALQQGKHNPFIRDSSLVRRAYFEADASYPEGDPNCFGATTSTDELKPNPWVYIRSNFVQDQITIISTRPQGTINLFNFQGQLVLRSTLNYESTIDLSSIGTGVYILHVQSEGHHQSFKVFKK